MIVKSNRWRGPRESARPLTAAEGSPALITARRMLLSSAMLWSEGGANADSWLAHARREHSALVGVVGENELAHIARVGFSLR